MRPPVLALLLLVTLLGAACGDSDDGSNDAGEERDARATASTSDDDRSEDAGAGRAEGGADEPGDEQVEYMTDVRDAYDGDAQFEACFDEAMEEMPPVPRDEWARMSGSFIIGCVQTDTGSGPIE